MRRPAETDKGAGKRKEQRIRANADPLLFLGYAASGYGSELPGPGFPEQLRGSPEASPLSPPASANRQQKGPLFQETLAGGKTRAINSHCPNVSILHQIATLKLHTRNLKALSFESDLPNRPKKGREYKDGTPTGGAIRKNGEKVNWGRTEVLFRDRMLDSVDIVDRMNRELSMAGWLFITYNESKERV